MLPVPSKKSVARAGSTLLDPHSSEQDRASALDTLSQWRALHHYPVNTFQATLRKKCRDFGIRNVTIAQRLKRTPSIVTKLARFPDMRLDRMQDIGGIRVVVPSMKDVQKLHSYYLSSGRVKHEAILPPKDYIERPKSDGYRSLHQVFKYHNTQKPELDGLRIELQIRTRLQHAWATAVETLGILEKSSFKTGEGSEDFKRFFLLSSALFSDKEGTPRPDALLTAPTLDLRDELGYLSENLKVVEKLRGVTVAASQIDTASTRKAAYHVMLLDLKNRRTSLVPFTESQFDLAKEFYLLQEQQATERELDVVLISVGDVKDVKKAYPNYFLDTQMFIKEIEKLAL